MTDRTYLQITRRLRVNRGPGRPELVSELGPERVPAPVTFDEHCQVDVAWLQHIGALQELPSAPEPAAATDGDEEPAVLYG